MKSIKILITTIGVLSGFVTAEAQQCQKDEETAKTKCSKEQFTQYEARLKELNAQLAGQGVGSQASQSYDGVGMEKAGLESRIALCKEAREGCIKSCQSDAQQKRSQVPPQESAAQQDDKKKQNCESGEPKKNEEQAKGTSNGMAEAMQALAALMQALGMQSPEQQQAEVPLCTQNPNDPQCKTDTATTDGGSTLTSGEFRRDDGATTVDGALASQEAPNAGAAAQPTMSGAIAGAGGAGLGGGGGGSGGSSRGRDSGDKKSDFDGTPKINLAGGAMGGGGGGGGGARGASNPGKGGGNPTASRTGIDNESQVGKIAAAAEERLRGPASNEPLGGISSVYYLDNFSKVEKRMITERNTLQEH